MPKRERVVAFDEEEDVSMIDRLSIDDDMEKEIKMDFEFFQFQQEDYHDLKNLLRSYLEKTVFELEELCDELIEQFYIGSSIKLEGNEQFVGLLTAFNITKHKEKAFVKSIHRFLLKHISNEAEKAVLQSFLSGDKGNVALIISERIESVPVQLTPHLYLQLQNEIEKAYQTELDDGLKEFEYKIDYFLVKCKVFYVKAGTGQQNAKKVKNEISAASSLVDEATGLEKCFYNPEEELLADFAEKVITSKTREIDCTHPNSMDRRVIKEEFLLYFIPSKNFTSLSSSLHKIIGGTQMMDL